MIQEEVTNKFMQIFLNQNSCRVPSKLKWPKETYQQLTHCILEKINHTQYLQCRMIQHATSPQWEQFEKICSPSHLLWITQSMQGPKFTSPATEAEAKWDIRSIDPKQWETRVFCCRRCYTDNVDKQTSQENREHSRYLLLFPRNLCLKKATTLRHTDTRSHAL